MSNGNPLQYSCLENPMDLGAWWAAVHGVAKSRTQLKRLSNSSSSSENLLNNTENFTYMGRKSKKEGIYVYMLLSCFSCVRLCATP